MRKVIAILETFFSVFVFAQTPVEPSGQEDLQNNRFEQKHATFAKEGAEATAGVRNAGDPVLIDGFLPFLLIAAVAMVFRYGLKREYKI